MKDKLFQLVIILVMALSLQLTAKAEDDKEDANSVQSGEISFEDTEESASSPYLVNQDKAIAWLSSVSSAVAAGGSGSVGLLDKDSTLHLTTGYLFCVTKLLDCTFILDAVLEGDVISARTKGDNKCPNMTAFWEAWLKNDLEERVRYLAPVANIAKITQFNSTERPKYIKCADKISSAIAEKPAERYAAGGHVQKVTEKALKVFEDLKAKNINILTTTGVSEEPGRNKKKTGKKK